MYTDVDQIKANVKPEWDKCGRTKFAKGAQVRVQAKIVGAMGSESDVGKFYRGRIGTVVAVTCNASGLIRGESGEVIHHKTGERVYQNTRMYTKYYVKFDDGRIHGFHSHHLEEVSKDTLTRISGVKSIFTDVV